MTMDMLINTPIGIVSVGLWWSTFADGFGVRNAGKGNITIDGIIHAHPNRVVSVRLSLNQNS